MIFILLILYSFSDIFWVRATDGVRFRVKIRVRVSVRLGLVLHDKLTPV